MMLLQVSYLNLAVILVILVNIQCFVVDNNDTVVIEGK